MKVEKRNLNDALRVLGKVVCQTSPVELYRSVRFVGNADGVTVTEYKLNLVEETPVSGEIRNISDAEKMFKMVTDGAMIPIEPKFVNPKMAPAIARCVFNTNELPSFVDRSNGLWDRLVILHFPNRDRIS